jgi:YHS domain-containing protein
MRATWFLSALSLLGLAVWLGGCSHEGGPAPAPPAASQPDPSEGLKQLDEADRQLAEKQKFCPVSGELLGSMGKPYKTTVKGRTVFLCCDGCLAEMNAHPDKYLKKLAK